MRLSKPKRTQFQRIREPKKLPKTSTLSGWKTVPQWSCSEKTQERAPLSLQGAAVEERCSKEVVAEVEQHCLLPEVEGMICS